MAEQQADVPAVPGVTRWRKKPVTVEALVADTSRDEWAQMSEADRGPCSLRRYSRDRKGYGKCNVKRHGKQIYLAHVLAWVESRGHLPPQDKPSILHHCDNPPCVEPCHLYAGTISDNTADMVSRGRQWLQRRTHCQVCGDALVPTYPGSPHRHCRRCWGASRGRRMQRKRERGELAIAPALRTHCPQGHPYDDENTYICKGKRQCKTCRRNRAQNGRAAELPEASCG